MQGVLFCFFFFFYLFIFWKTSAKRPEKRASRATSQITWGKHWVQYMHRYIFYAFISIDFQNLDSFLLSINFLSLGKGIIYNSIYSFTSVSLIDGMKLRSYHVQLMPFYLYDVYLLFFWHY